jgi:D-sedoheptulose 7-phosphate isomerase
MGSIQTYFQEIENLLKLLAVEPIDQAIATLRQARLCQKQVFTLGNGGSASTASHFVCDLSKNTRRGNLPPFRVIGLADNLPALLAYANDDGYENIFSMQLANLVQPGDIVIAISASGNSPNVLKAIELAKSTGAKTIGFTGFDGGRLASLVDINLWVPSNCIEQVEDIHLMLEHLICKTLRDQPEAAGTP